MGNGKDETKDSISPEERLFAPNRVAPTQESARPVVIIGLPRSGTSFLSHALCQLPGYYVFDDLYLINRPAAKQAGTANLSPEQLDKLLSFLGWQIRARHRHGIYALPAVTEDQIEQLNAALRSSFSDQPGTVFDLQAEWLYRIAQAGGAENWGFKMPKAFLQAKDLFEAYPNLQMICLMRQPEDVLASYKHMPLDPTGDGDPRRYHPLVYAPYWRMAARNYQKLAKRHPGQVHLVRFGDFIADPLKTTNDIATLLDTAPATEITRPKRPNTSFRKSSGGASQARITGLEARLVALFCGSSIRALGFETRQRPPLRLSDLTDFMRCSGTAIWFHIRRLISKVTGKKF